LRISSAFLVTVKRTCLRSGRSLVPIEQAGLDHAVGYHADRVDLVASPPAYVGGRYGRVEVPDGDEDGVLLQCEAVLLEYPVLGGEGEVADPVQQQPGSEVCGCPCEFLWHGGLLGSVSI
jgi:hypothetical protein